MTAAAAHTLPERIAVVESDVEDLTAAVRALTAQVSTLVTFMQRDEFRRQEEQARNERRHRRILWLFGATNIVLVAMGILVALAGK